MIQITLYTKNGCGLCDVFKTDLSVIAEKEPQFVFTLTEIDITQDHDLFARYRYLIPVVQIGPITLQAPISKSDIEKALETAVS